VDVPSKSTAVKNKIKEQISTRSVDYKNKIKEKYTNTILEKYGVDHPLKSPIIKDKVKSVFLEKYGVDHNWKSEAVRNKIRETNLKRYGTVYPQQIKTISDKILLNRYNTMIEKYGVKSNAHFHLNSNQIEILNNKDKFVEAIKNRTYFEISLEFGL
jgi:hypothetical protein